MNPFQEMFELNWDLWRCGNCKSKVKVYFHPYDSKIFFDYTPKKIWKAKSSEILWYCAAVMFHFKSTINFWPILTSLQYQIRLSSKSSHSQSTAKINMKKKVQVFGEKYIFLWFLSIFAVFWRGYIPKLRYHCINTWSSLLANDYNIII